MRVDPLIVFCSVVEQESFSKAAEILYLTQPAISISVKQLELEYGQPLLIRKNKGQIKLTHMGEKLYELAKQMKQIRDSIESLRQDSIKQTKDIINFQCALTAGAHLLTAEIIRLQENHPDIQLSIMITNAEKATEDLIQGKIDLAMLFSPEYNPDLQPVKTWEDELILVVSNRHPFIQSPPTPDQLLNYSYILGQAGSPVRQILDNLFKETLGSAPNCILELGNADTVKQAVISMNKPSYMLKSMVQNELETGQLIRVETGLNLQCKHVLFHRKNRYLTDVMRSFVNKLKVISM
jgi:DNA-binding transcriptional LysR family regulator